MKKIILSAAVAAMAFSTSAMAADKGIDIDVSGQAVIYYETAGASLTTAGAKDNGLFDKDNSMANAGIQLNIGSDLGNNFTFGSQLTYITTQGLEKNLVSTTRSSTTQSLNNDLTSQLMLTKIFVAKQISNTTIKMGRQELPKSLSPLAFTEGWNVFKNTFDAVLAINTDIPKTTVVAAYVSQSNNPNTDLSQKADLYGGAVTKGAYMLTVQTKLIPMTTLTGSYYRLSGIELTAAVTDPLEYADAYWLDAQVKPMDMITLYGQIGTLNLSDIRNNGYKDTSALGLKVAAKVGAISGYAAYSNADNGTLAVRNTGTNTKSPFYTQMIYNQAEITNDASAIVLNGAYNFGDMGKVIAQYGMMKDEDEGNIRALDTDSTELDIIYKVKASGVQYFAAYIRRDMDNQGNLGSSSYVADSEDIVRVWGRYNF